MSGRIRTIKPDLLADAVTAGLSDAAFRLFIAMILLADDYGNFRAEPAFLRGQIFWKVEPSSPYEAAVAELTHLVSFYDVKGQRYGTIKNWSKHQRVSHPGKPRVPGPENADLLGITETLAKPSGDPRESLVPDHGHGHGHGRGSREELESLRPPPPPTSHPSERPSGVRDVATTRSIAVRRLESSFFCEAYERGIVSATHRPFAFPREHARTLDDCIDKHSGGLVGARAQEWVEHIAAQFASDVENEDPKFWSSLSPKGLLRWLNEGRANRVSNNHLDYVLDEDDDDEPRATSEMIAAEVRHG